MVQNKPQNNSSHLLDRIRDLFIRIQCFEDMTDLAVIYAGIDTESEKTQHHPCFSVVCRSFLRMDRFLPGIVRDMHDLIKKTVLIGV